MTARQRVVCRVCGDWGYEEADDPCPGLCPRCFNRVLYEATEALLVDVQDDTLSVTQLLDRHEVRLRARGLSEQVLHKFRRQADGLLAALAEDVRAGQADAPAGEVG